MVVTIKSYRICYANKLNARGECSMSISSYFDHNYSGIMLDSDYSEIFTKLTSGTYHSVNDETFQKL